MTAYRERAPSADEHFVELARVSPLEADLLQQVLLEHGVLCRVLGTRDGALLGVGQHILEVRVEVRAADLARARELLGAFFGA